MFSLFTTFIMGKKVKHNQVQINKVFINPSNTKHFNLKHDHFKNENITCLLTNRFNFPQNKTNRFFFFCIPMSFRQKCVRIRNGKDNDEGRV